MAQRRFGPTLGAGVVVIEKEAEKILEPAALGVTAYLGILERGDTGKLLQTFSKKGTTAKIGGRIEESQVPDAASDFWELSNGAGELHFVRVTDGTERKAELTLWSREAVPVQVAKLRAHNGGRWGGRLQAIVGEWATTATDLTETTLDTTKTMLADEFKGAKLTLDAISSKSYEVVSNTALGVLTVKSDSTMKTDYGAGTDKGYQLILDRDTAREITFEIADGEIDQANEFGLKVYVNGDFVKRWSDLNMDPSHARYFVNLINDDDSNDVIEAVDLLAPASTPPAKRPANEFGTVGTISSLSLTRDLAALKVITSPTNANPTMVIGTTTDAMKFRDKLTITMTGATTFTVVSQLLGLGGSLGAAGTIGALYTPNSPLLPPFTITNGGTVLATGDVLEIDYFPLRANELAGALLYPNYDESPLKAFRISGNTHKTISILSGDLTAVSAATKKWMVVWPQPLGGTGRTGGYDGLASITDSSYTGKLDPSTSSFRELLGQNKGLVKVATPGKTATAVQKQGLAFAEAMNWQYRVEIPSGTLQEDTAIGYINATIGRNDFGVTEFPSYGYVDNPAKPGQLKLQTLTGMIHGREALVAKNFDGYHKAAAGVEVTLPKVLKLPATGLNEEALNPVGINVIKNLKGNVVIWGDRTISLDPAWKWKHQRETMSHYENRLRESFDFIVFAINDSETQALLLTSLRAMFLPEFAKRAIRGKNFDDAIRIKIDNDINNDATRANGDLFAELTLRLADTVERFIIRVGKAGIFESLS